MTTPQDITGRMRREIAKLIDDTVRYQLGPGEFSGLIGMLNALDEQLTQAAAVAARTCPECGPLPAIDPELPVLVRAVQTCGACPSQWDAWDATGQYYYLRFRSGLGSVETAESANAYRSSGPLASVADFRHGDHLDGSMGLDEFLAHAGMRMQVTT